MRSDDGMSCDCSNAAFAAFATSLECSVEVDAMSRNGGLTSDFYLLNLQRTFYRNENYRIRDFLKKK